MRCSRRIEGSGDVQADKLKEENVGISREQIEERLNSGISRRRFMQMTSALVGTAAVGSLLTACSADGGDDEDDAADTGSGDEEDASEEDDATEDDEEDSGEESDGDAAEGEDGEEMAGEGTFGGSMVAATETPPPTLDVMTSTTSASREATWFSQDTLITYGEEYDMIPLIAESWEANDDATVYTFNLRQGMLFHNGNELVADDVVASVERFIEVTPRADELAMVDSYEAVDDYTVEFQLSEPGTALLDALALPYCCCVIMPRDIIEGKGPDELEVEDIVGTGPYRLVEWVPDQHILYERFEDYEPLDEPRSGLGGGKIPYFDEIRLVAVPETSSRVAGLETGEYHFAASPPVTDYERLDQHEEIDVHILEELRWAVILFNHRNELTADLKFRQAIQAAANMEELAMAVTSGNPDFFRVQPSMWFPSTPWYNEEGADLYNQNDMERAQQLLDESSYDGQELVMVTNRSYDYMYASIVTLAEQLEQGLGINVRTDVVDWPAQQSRWEQDDWHISTTGYLSQAIFAPGAFAGFYGGGGASAGAGYENEEMTAAFERGAQAVDMEEKQAAYAEVQRIFHEDVAGLKVADFFGFTATRSELQNFSPWYNMTRFWGTWLDES